MVEPRVVPRAAHSLSRRDVDPDALKVLYRLHQAHYTAYLVGGSVRDLLLGRRPKDFDIGTSAHPAQIKKLFRNCWIIGRRFRLAHVRFGSKVIEVATFRRQVQPGEEVVQDGVPAPVHDAHQVAAQPSPTTLLRDNTFGTPEEDAFRRDFTVNALFYDIATFSVIDYVNGMEDLAAGIVRTIGDPDVRFVEDPVRMQRAVALAARLGFTIDPPSVEAMKRLRHEIAKSAPARLIEEYYKILRSGAAERTFRLLSEMGLLDPVAPQLVRGSQDALWRSLAALDAYRNRFEALPDTLTNPILLGSVLVPLGLVPRHGGSDGAGAIGDHHDHRPNEAAAKLGLLPLARRDVERLRQIIALQRRLRDLEATPRAQRALTHRSVFRDSLTWFEIHGGTPDILEHWITVLAERGVEEPPGEIVDGEPPPFRRRRRRRRRGRRSRRNA